MTLLRLFCCGDRFAVKAVTSPSGFLLLHQPIADTADTGSDTDFTKKEARTW